LADGAPGGAALRLRVSKSRVVVVEDAVRGRVEFPAGSVEDFIIIKSNGDPLYNFSAAVDDHAMAITHVIRGEEHLANTPKQLLLYEAFGWAAPIFAHIPIILNDERRKLSKRDGAAFVRDYERMGYLPEALRNFLALLGWSPGGDRELLSVAEMIRDFRIEDVVKHPAVFDTAKLAWMNKAYIKAAPRETLVDKLLPLLPDGRRFERAYAGRVVALFQDRVHTLADIVSQGAYFFSAAPPEPSAEALAKYCSAPDTAQRLAELHQALGAASDFSPQAVELAIRGLAEAHGSKAAAYIHPLRVALTGQPVSPGIFEVCSVLGRDVSLARIDALCQHLASGPRARALSDR
jgi:glutamyl-tRNA synthetase